MTEPKAMTGLAKSDWSQNSYRYAYTYIYKTAIDMPARPVVCQRNTNSFWGSYMSASITK